MARRNVNNFWDIKWGPDESKGDNNLRNYFVPISEYEDILAGRFRYIIGRKGTGKTAVLEKIRLDIESESMAFHKNISLRDFPISIFRSLRERSYVDKSQYVPVWRFLILIELCKFILQDNGIEQYELKKEIEDFIKLNFPGDFAMVDTLKSLERNNSKVSVLQGWLTVGNEKGTELSSSVHYNRASDVLFRKIQEFRSKSSYFIFLMNSMRDLELEIRTSDFLFCHFSEQLKIQL